MRAVSALMLLVAAAPTGTACSMTSAAPISADDYRATLEQALPIGTGADKVEQYLRAHAIENSGYIASEHRIDAIRREPAGRKLVGRSLTIRFEFSDRDALSRIIVEQAFTGP